MNDLDLFGLPQIFQTMQDTEKSGTLKIQKNEKEARIIFKSGMICMATFQYRQRSVLVEALWHSHELERDVVEGLFSKQRSSKKALIPFLRETDLQESCLKDEKFIARIYTNQLSEELYELFDWLNVHFEFTENYTPPDLADSELLGFPIQISPQSISMEAMRRRDEWVLIHEQIPSQRDIPFLIQHPSHIAQNLDTDLTNKIAATLGSWSEFVNEIPKTGYSQDEILKIFTTLARNGAIKSDSLKHIKKTLQVIIATKACKNFVNIQPKLRLPYENLLHIFYILHDQDKISIETSAEVSKVLTILSLINGIRDFDEILEQARMSVYNLASICNSLVTAKFIQLKSSDELLQMVDLDILREDTKKCIRLYERIEELEHKTINTVRWLAYAYESCGLTSKSVEKFRELGMWSMENNNYPDAVKAYRKVIEFASDDASQLEAYEKLIVSYNKWGKREQAAEVSAKYARKVSVADKRKAIMVLDNANRNYPSSPSNLELMASLYLEMNDKENAIQTYGILANLMRKQEEFDKSLEAYTKILAIDPQNIKAHLELARGFIELGRGEDGIKQYKTLGEILNGIVQHALNSGQIPSLGNIPEILNDVCESILTYEPDNIPAREWLVDTYITIGDEKNALNILRELLGFLQKEENSEKLTNNLCKVIVLDPDDFRSRKLLADILLRQKKRKAAIHEYMQLGMRSCEKNDLRRAAEAFDAIIAVDPFNLTARQKRSEILFARNLHAKAVEEYRLVGYLAKAIGMIPEAIQAFAQIAELAGDKEFWCFEEIGTLCEQLQENQKAIEAYKNYSLKSLAHANYGEVYQASLRILRLNNNDADGIKLKRIAEQKLAFLEKTLAQ